MLRENGFFKHEPAYLVLATVLTETNRLKMNTKTRIAKPLPIIPEIEEALKPGPSGKIVPLVKKEREFVFTHNGEAYRKRKLERVWDLANKRASEKCGTPAINLYNGLKHSFGGQRINAGASLDAIKAVMGHTDTRTTERYAKYAVEKLAPVMRWGRQCANSVQRENEVAK